MILSPKHSFSVFTWFTRKNSKFYSKFKGQHPVLVRQMSIRLFEDGDHAELYKKFRPLHPKDMAEYIISFCKQKIPPDCLDTESRIPLTVDVGCGSGQSSQLIAPYCQRVIGLDISSTQIGEAKTNNTRENVEYLVGSADSLPVSSGTVSLVMCANSFHWLDQEKFYKEMDRVLMPGGSLAIFGYHFNEFEPSSCNKIVHEFVFTKLKDYWDSRRSMVDSGYKDVVLPYQDSERRDDFKKTTQTSLKEYLGYISTLSSYQKYIKEHPEEPVLQNLEQQFLKELAATSASAVTFTVIRRYFLLICSKQR